MAVSTLLLISSVATEVQDNALNVPQVLLPFVTANSVATNYTLKALNGCFHWSSTKPEVASVKPLKMDTAKYLPGDENHEHGCSGSAVVTVTSTSKNREIAVILAEDETSGTILRCDVFVDAIHRIEIATTTRELLLGESPEVFDVYGYDEEGNTFSSLGSTVLKWYLSPVPGNNTVDPKTVLRFLWFHETSYETEAEIYALEQKNLRGGSVIMEGTNTGEALVSAQLVHSEYKDVPPSTVKLIVVDNIILQPSSDVYILVHTKVFYRVKQLRRRHSRDIEMPCSQYQLKLSHPEYATLDHQKSCVVGKAKGTTKVILVDNNMMHTKSARQPSATVHVVEPASLGFTVSPGNVWVLEAGREYAITIDVYDAKKHKILITEDTFLASMFPKEFFEMKFKSSNSSYHYVRALKPGKAQINATLTGVRSEDGKTLLKLKKAVFGEQPVQIYNPIKVQPELVVFPWEPEVAVGKSYKVQLKATGGSGGYQWSSQNYSMTSVTNNGLATSGNAIGSTRIKASDVKNTLHYGEATVVVLPADRINFLPSAVEAEVGQYLTLPLSVAAYIVTSGRRELKVFEDCSRMPLKISFSDDRIFKLVDASSVSEQRQGKTVTEGACKTLLVNALKPGFTTVTVKYSNGNTTLKAIATIGAYPPLVVVDPSSTEVATVALGSSKVVALEGGPLPWILDNTGFYESLSAEEEDWVGIQAVDRPENTGVSVKRHKLHFFRVTCRQIKGEQLLIGQVGNKITAKNQYPAISYASLRFLCTPPGSLSLRPDIILPVINGQQRTLESCQDADKRIPVRNSRELLILLTVRDASGQTFDNATSLDIRWSSSDSDLARILHKHTTVPKIKSNYTASAFQVIQLSARTGFVRIEAKITGYNQVALYAAGIYDDELKSLISPPIAGSLGLMLVNERQVVPNSLVLFNHPKNEAKLTIKDGVGDFVVKGIEESLAVVSFKKKSEFVVTPKSAGFLTVSVYDVCIDSDSPATAELRFSDIHIIDVVVADKVELYKTIKAVVQMKDRDGHLLSVQQMGWMKLAPELSSAIIQIKPGRGDSHDDKAIYTLKGETVGITSLTYHAVQANGKQIRSKPRDIQVFPPLRLDPRHITLIRGATFQIKSHGGPQPQSTTVYEIANQTVSLVNHVGVITALNLGLTTVTGMAQGSDPHSGKTIVYSRDQITVEVITLKGFKIHATTTTLISGSEVGVYAVGYDGESPFTFASSIPYLQFHWSVTNTKVASLKSAYHASGVTVKNEKDFRILLNTHKAGQVTIKLRVEVVDLSYKQAMEHAVLEDEVQIEVFDKLKILFPNNGELLLPQNIVSKIRTNRDGVARMSYQVAHCGAKTAKTAWPVSVALDGTISTTTTSGSAVIHVTASEDSGIEQTAVVRVEVKTVASITLVPLTTVPYGLNNLHFIPLSASAKFDVTLHDNVGRKFDVSTISLKHRLHRFDVVQVVPDADNATYSISAVGIGNAIFKVWNEHNENIADYIRINVSHGIQPSSATVTLGSMLCLKSVIKTSKESVPPVWSTSNSEVLSIDPKNGVAIGNSIGSAIVYLSHGEMTTNVEVQVQKASSLHLLSSGIEAILHDPSKPKQAYDIAVKIGDAFMPKPNQCDDTVEYGDRRSLRIPFKCLLTAANQAEVNAVETILNVKPKYINGQPYCEISIVDLPASLLKQISTFNVVISLQATLADHENHVFLQSDVVRMPFIPAFVLSSKDIQMSSDKSSVLVKVTGIASHLNNLKIKSADSSLVDVQLLKTSLEGSYQDYEIRRIGKPGIADQNVTVIFESAVTQQKEKLNVYLEADAQESDALLFKPQYCPPLKEKVHQPGLIAKVLELLGENSSFFLLYTVLIATVILIIFVYHNMMQRDRSKLAEQGIPPSPYYLHHGLRDHSPRFYPQSASPYMPGSGGKRPASSYGGSPSATPGSRTLFSVQQ
eukprot:gene16623-18313_t